MKQEICKRSSAAPLDGYATRNPRRSPCPSMAILPGPIVDFQILCTSLDARSRRLAEPEVHSRPQICSSAGPSDSYAARNTRRGPRPSTAMLPEPIDFEILCILLDARPRRMAEPELHSGRKSAQAMAHRIATRRETRAATPAHFEHAGSPCRAEILRVLLDAQPRRLAEPLEARNLQTLKRCPIGWLRDAKPAPQPLPIDGNTS